MIMDRKRTKNDRRKTPMFEVNFNSMVQVSLLGVMSWIAFNVQAIKTDNKLLNQTIGYMEKDFNKHQIADDVRFSKIEARLIK